LAAACCTATFVSFNRGELRNYRVYAVWSAALVLAGSLPILPPPRAALLLGAAAIVATTVGVKVRRLMPGYQGLEGEYIHTPNWWRPGCEGPPHNRPIPGMGW